MSRVPLVALLVTLIPLVGCDRFNAAPNSGASSQMASSLKEDFSFQERCGKAAADWFKSGYGDGTSSTKEGQMSSDFSNHYNRKLNKCFMLLRTASFSKTGGALMETLYDVHEHKEYGNFMMPMKANALPIVCTVLGVQCESEGEWRQLIKPYMEE